MQVDSISKIASSVMERGKQPQQTKPESSTISTASPNSANVTSVRAPTLTEAPSSRAQSGDSATSVPVLTFAEPLSTTVAGKNYALSIEQAGDVYIASVPNPPGATATGSSAETAESNLNIKLDTLA